MPPRKDFVSVILSNKQATTPVKTATNETEKLLQEARKLYDGGNDDEAMTLLRRILSSEPMSAESYLLLGLIHLRQSELDQAVSSLKTALFWDNRLIEAYSALVRIYVQKGDCLQAQNYFRTASEVDSENPEVAGLQRVVERCSK